LKKNETIEDLIKYHKQEIIYHANKLHAITQDEDFGYKIMNTIKSFFP